VARSLEYWAATRGGRAALFEGATTLTYYQWNEYADMLADALVGRGLGANDVIAVRCRNRIEWAVIALACAKIDARLLTLDPELAPRAIRERMIAGGASAIIVGDVAPSRIAPALEGMHLQLRATMDGAYPGFFNFWDLFPPVAQPRFGRAQPSLLTWTAGPSPLPVGLPPRRAAPASMSRPPVPETGASLITVPLHRVWSAVQFWAALVAGRSICLMRAFDAATALDTIRERRITHWSALPETFLDLRRLGAEAVREADTSSLRELVIGGAAGPWPLKAWLADIFGSILSEAYGSTEAGLISTMAVARHDEKPGSCGRPIRGVTVEIRDATGLRLPSGSVGEIWARTPRSLECDLPAAQTRRDAEGYVATGDTGRVDDDGFIYLTGRMQTQSDADMLRAG
jgi:acyl-CoA synthetase (AMP-forming)/AMP-acid ligase II